MSASSSGGSTTSLLWLVVVGVIGYLGYGWINRPSDAPPAAPYQEAVPHTVPAPKQEVAPAVVLGRGEVTNDPLCSETGDYFFDTIKEDAANGIYNYQLNPKEVKVLPRVPRAGEVWHFKFTHVLVCPVGFPHMENALGMTDHRKLVEVTDPNERRLFNADDFLEQSVYQLGAFARTGEGVISLTDSYTWHVTDAAAGKPIAMAFNLRPSEMSRAKGWAIVEITVEK
jgi:hypothetical protein